MTRRLPPPAEEIAHKSADIREEARVLLRQFVVLDKTVPAKWLAAATGVGRSTIYKHTDDTDPEELDGKPRRVTIDELWAAAKADPDDCRPKVLDWLAEIFDVEWRQAAPASACESVVTGQVIGLIRKLTGAIDEGVQAIADTTWTVGEAESFGNTLAQLQHWCQTLIPALERIAEEKRAAANVVDADFQTGRVSL